MTVETLLVNTPTHGRVLVERPTALTAQASTTPMTTIVACHGYAQSADDLMSELQQIRGSEACTLVSVQALHRFYARGEQHVVASWMTRQDRDVAIADNIEYVDRAIEQVCGGAVPGRLFVLGFSQGVAMAYRAGVLGRYRVDGIVAVGGDVPPDCKDVALERWPRVLIAAGDTDFWYTADKVAADVAYLTTHGVRHDVLRYPAGHVFTDDVRAAIAAFIAA